MLTKGAVVNKERIRVLPHYKETLTHGTIIMPPYPKLIRHFINLVNSIPTLEHVTVIGKAGQEKNVESFLNKLKVKYNYVGIPTSPTFWAYDVFMGNQHQIAVNEELVQHVPLLMWQRCHEKPLTVCKTYFETGNHLVAELNETLVISGLHDWYKIRQGVKGQEDPITHIKTLQETFDARFLMPTATPPWPFYHLDLVAKPLREGVIAMLDPSSIKLASLPKQKRCENLNKTLKILGDLAHLIDNAGCLRLKEITDYPEFVMEFLTLNEMFNKKKYQWVNRLTTSYLVKTYLKKLEHFFKNQGFEVVFFKTNNDMVFNFQSPASSIICSPDQVVMAKYPEPWLKSITEHNADVFKQHGYEVTLFEDTMINCFSAGLECAVARTSLNT